VGGRNRISATDHQTAAGRRDRAILLLALQTGLPWNARNRPRVGCVRNRAPGVESAMARRTTKILAAAMALGFGLETSLAPGVMPGVVSEAIAFGHRGFGGGRHFGGFGGGHEVRSSS
jgi:hypothetical protein